MNPRDTSVIGAVQSLLVILRNMPSEEARDAIAITTHLMGYNANPQAA
jgi:hypothetical protein